MLPHGSCTALSSKASRSSQPDDFWIYPGRSFNSYVGLLQDRTDGRLTKSTLVGTHLVKRCHGSCGDVGVEAFFGNGGAGKGLMVAMMVMEMVVGMVVGIPFFVGFCTILFLLLYFGLPYFSCTGFLRRFLRSLVGAR